jgi:hypothetical protein
MDGKSARAQHIGDLRRASHGVEKQSRADAAISSFAMHGEPRQNQKRHRMARHSLDDALVPDNVKTNQFGLYCPKLTMLGFGLFRRSAPDSGAESKAEREGRYRARRIMSPKPTINKLKFMGF